MQDRGILIAVHSGPRNRPARWREGVHVSTRSSRAPRVVPLSLRVSIGLVLLTGTSVYGAPETGALRVAQLERKGTSSVRTSGSSRSIHTQPTSSSSSSRATTSRPSENEVVRREYRWDEDPWESYQEGGHCLYGTNGELLHAPDGRPCAPPHSPRDADLPASPAPTAPRGSERWGRDACVAGSCEDAFGTYSWADGSRYTGEFRGGKPHGEGTLLYSDGGSYAGQWADGSRSGYGTAVYANGSTQSGRWERGRFLGAASPAERAKRGRMRRRPVRWPDLTQPARRVGGGGKDAAVIVGLERYAHVSEIARARDNAAAWFQYFVRTRDVPVEHVTLLLDEDGTREEIEDAVARAAKLARRGGTLWFVFIGHGAPARDGQDGLLVGFDAQQKARSLAARSLPRSELLASLESTRASSIQVFLDACFSGRSGSGEPLVAGLQPLVVATSVATSDRRTSLFTAARGDEFAGPLPGAARPAFSYLALGGLRGWADGDADGRVTSGELHDYISRAIQVTVQGRRQRPTLLGDRERPLGRSAREKGPDLADLVLDTARRRP